MEVAWKDAWPTVSDAGDKLSFNAGKQGISKMVSLMHEEVGQQESKW